MWVVGCFFPGLSWRTAAIKSSSELGKKYHTLNSALLVNIFSLCHHVTTFMCLLLVLFSSCTKEICQGGSTTLSPQLPPVHFSVGTKPDISQDKPHLITHFCTPGSERKQALPAGWVLRNGGRASCCFLQVKSRLNFLPNDAQTSWKRISKSSRNLQVAPDIGFSFNCYRTSDTTR